MSNRRILFLIFYFAVCFWFPLNCRGDYEFVVLETVAVSGSAEIVSCQSGSFLLAVTNPVEKRCDFYPWYESRLLSESPCFSVRLDGEPTSVSFLPAGDMALVTVLDADCNSPGKVVAVGTSGDKQGRIMGEVPVGIGPDNICAGNTGKWAVVANEAEEDAGTEGSIGVIDLCNSVYEPCSGRRQLSYRQLSGLEEFCGIPGGTIEPEYCAMSDEDELAVVSCQENDAIVLLDFRGGEPVHGGVIRLAEASDPDGVSVMNWYDSVTRECGWLVGAACEGRKACDGTRGGQRVEFFFVWDASGKLQWASLFSINLSHYFDGRRVDPEGIDMVFWDDKAAIFVGCEKAGALVCILLEASRAYTIAGIVQVGKRPEGVHAVVRQDHVVIISGNEGTGKSDGSISICRLVKK
jgi:hypothetical protein